MTKAELYELVESDRSRWGFDRWHGGAVDGIALSRRCGIDIEFMKFRTQGLRGVAFTDDNMTFLSERLSPEQHNFYACHELFHHLNHRALPISSFQCFDMAFANSTYYEWEANEGAAELLVPYKSFLEFVGQFPINSRRALAAVQRAVANVFNVPLTTAVLRFDGLKYELRQYLCGVHVDSIEVMSSATQEEKGIFVRSLNELYPAPTAARRPIDVWDEAGTS